MAGKTRTMWEMLLWLSKGFLPLFLVGLLIFAITRHVLASLLIIVPISLILVLIGIAAFYVREIRRTYPFLHFMSVGQCPLCGDELVREKFTENLFLLPHTFKTLRHYEKKHEDIGGYAEKARLSFTIFVHLFIPAFGAVFALRGLEYVSTSEMSSIEVLPYFLIPFFFFQLIASAILAYLLLWKRDSMLGK